MLIYKFSHFGNHKKDSVCLHLPHLLLNGWANETAQNVANAALISKIFRFLYVL